MCRKARAHPDYLHILSQTICRNDFGIVCPQERRTALCRSYSLHDSEDQFVNILRGLSSFQNSVPEIQQCRPHQTRLAWTQHNNHFLLLLPEHNYLLPFSFMLSENSGECKCAIISGSRSIGPFCFSFILEYLQNIFH